jgi:hypothetical protein
MTQPDFTIKTVSSGCTDVVIKGILVIQFLRQKNLWES